MIDAAPGEDIRPIRVLFLTRYPVEGASSRYRVYQYLPHLEAMGIRCEIQNFMDTRMYRLSMQPGRLGTAFGNCRRVDVAPHKAKGTAR